MTYYPDLSRYEYADKAELPGSPKEPAALNVGWLDAWHPHPTGDVPAGFAERLLEELIAQRYHAFRGYHYCELCQRQASEIGPDTITVEGEAYSLGDREVQVVGSSRGFLGSRRRYNAPSTICHYIEAHGYRPPDEFIEAVLALPPEPPLPGPGEPFSVGEHVAFFPAEIDPGEMWLSWDEAVIDEVRPGAQSFGFHFVSEPDVRHGQGMENIVRRTVYYRRWRRVATEALARTNNAAAAFEAAKPWWIRVLAEHPLHGSASSRRHPALPAARKRDR